MLTSAELRTRVPRDASLLREVVVERSKAWQQRADSSRRHFSRHKSRLRPQRVSPGERVDARQIWSMRIVPWLFTSSSLRASIVVVAVHPRAHNARSSHRRGAAWHRHAHHQVRLRHIHLQESLSRCVDLRLEGSRSSCRCTGTVHGCWSDRRYSRRSWLKSPADLFRRRHRVDHGVGHRVAEAFVVGEEEGLVADDRSAERAAEVVLHHVVVSHGLK